MTWFGGREAAQRDRVARAGARRRAREVEAAADGADVPTLDEVFEGTPGRYCYLCKLPVARAQASVEHVVPLAKGGSADRSNCRLSHRVCNSEKGARTSPRGPGLRRTMWRRKRKDRALPEDTF